MYPCAIIQGFRSLGSVFYLPNYICFEQTGGGLFPIKQMCAEKKIKQRFIFFANLHWFFFSFCLKWSLRPSSLKGEQSKGWK